MAYSLNIAPPANKILGLKFTTNNLGITGDATIDGFNIKINGFAPSGFLANIFHFNTQLEFEADPWLGVSVSQLNSITTAEPTDFEYGFGLTTDFAGQNQTFLNANSIQTIPIIDLITNNRLCLRILGDVFSNGGTINFNTTSPSVAIKIHYNGGSSTDYIPYDEAFDFTASTLTEEEFDGINTDAFLIPTKIKLQPATTFSNVVEATHGAAGPNAHSQLGDVGDGLTYSSPSVTQRDRLLADSTGIENCAFLNTFPNGFKLLNFFEAGSSINSIPLDATIVGVELIAGTDFDGSGNSRITTFGSNLGNVQLDCYFHNGVSYSPRLRWDVNDDSVGINEFGSGLEILSVGDETLESSNNRGSFSGPNIPYKNSEFGDDVLFGGPTDLSGLEWDPANQENFGFGFAVVDGSGNTSFGVSRGIRMKVYYLQPQHIKIKIQASEIPLQQDSDGNIIFFDTKVKIK